MEGRYGLETPQTTRLEQLCVSEGRVISVTLLQEPMTEVNRVLGPATFAHKGLGLHRSTYTQIYFFSCYPCCFHPQRESVGWRADRMH